ncbi:putative phage protein [Streptomyces scabiei 87.22]|uniref:Putative phage protein n=1 Tax=Streptomyces scabiei (strain 87.22) TaxID=680198 RepID=C9Z935_STRSW|nr:MULTISPECIES: 3'-5' exoribonuclease [Streptomyces]MBP5875670.1 3'-5' exoribonuclease [Streptomyces sp. LBUM 1477]MDX2652125.1 3'-5' exoribonuclease [Streptomyces scabiei]MDX2725849.1 3'-5' exoribonuclease [Streptomyces scabiei]MDX2749639.1 3'-5' exoribonuclease [Streptomyces scabiei]MDX2863968.1 3'-5' exoribonuclease [Streptomyces scabiei]
MTAIDYDLEFLEDGRTIELISIGLVCDDGREYYAVSRRLTARTWRGWQLRRRVRNHPWLMANVIPRLPQPHGDWRNHMPNDWLFNYLDPAVKRHKTIATDVRDFILAAGPDAELWADYGAYDHVALAQLFGPMIDLPEGVPMFTHDIQQERARLGIPDTALPKQHAGQHNALADARHNRTVRLWLAEQDTRRGTRQGTLGPGHRSTG